VQRLRHAATIGVMTLLTVGSGAAAGWVNTPRAEANPLAAAPPAVHLTSDSPSVEQRAAEQAAKTVARPAAPAPVHRAAPTPRPAVPKQQAVASAFATRSTTPAANNLASANTCSAALAYLRANSAPGFQFECPGYALGHQAMTCVNVAGVCPGIRLIVISTVCTASYMNEAHNSWIVAGYRSGSIDPYGYCH
jgi:hypothetical protein